ncbi:MAG TPA: pseudouridine synthase, partial [Pirellulaceae bacterium]|nr:pseudouridine synthase [Pirellulaceae bacterium]
MDLPPPSLALVPLTVLYQDDYLVAVNKPPGLLVHRSDATPGNEPTLLRHLRDQIGRFLFPVHRLDRPTSGVMVYALSSEMAARMNKLFSQRRVVKTYRAIVRGWMDDQGVIDLPLREQLDFSMETYEQTSRSLQAARTCYRTLARYEMPWPMNGFPTSRYSMVQVHPETGRWHQIRRHLNHVAHPIIGDHRHGDHRHNELFAHHLGIHRMLLVAERLEFPHPHTSIWLTLTAPLGTSFPPIRTGIIVISRSETR